MQNLQTQQILNHFQEIKDGDFAGYNIQVAVDQTMNLQ